MRLQVLKFSAALAASALLAPAGAGARAADAVSTDPLIEQVRAEALGVSPLDRPVLLVETDNDGKTRHRAMVFNPALEEDRRWLLLERNREPVSPQQVADFAHSRTGALPRSYRTIADFLALGATLTETTESEAIYRVESLGPGSILIDGLDISAALAAEIHIRTDFGRPFVEDIRLHVAQTFKPRWLVKIRSGQGRIRFSRPEPGAPPVILLEEFRVAGSRPFGSIDFHTRSCFFDHRPAREMPPGPVTTHAGEGHPCHADDEGEPSLPAP